MTSTSKNGTVVTAAVTTTTTTSTPSTGFAALKAKWNQSGTTATTTTSTPLSPSPVSRTLSGNVRHASMAMTAQPMNRTNATNTTKMLPNGNNNGKDNMGGDISTTEPQRPRSGSVRRASMALNMNSSSNNNTHNLDGTESRPRAGSVRRASMAVNMNNNSSNHSNLDYSAITTTTSTTAAANRSKSHQNQNHLDIKGGSSQKDKNSRDYGPTGGLEARTLHVLSPTKTATKRFTASVVSVNGGGSKILPSNNNNNNNNNINNDDDDDPDRDEITNENDVSGNVSTSMGRRIPSSSSSRKDNESSSKLHILPVFGEDSSDDVPSTPTSSKGKNRNINSSGSSNSTGSHRNDNPLKISKRSSSTGRRVIQKGKLKSKRNTDFDGYASYSSSEGNLSFSECEDISEQEEDESDNDGSIVVPQPSKMIHECHTHNKSSSNLPNRNTKKKETVVVKSTVVETKSIPSVTTTTTTAPTATSTLHSAIKTTTSTPPTTTTGTVPTITTTRPMRKKSGGRMAGSGAKDSSVATKKQTVIYTRQAPTIKDLPVFSHTDHEDDTILQALCNKEALFSQLRVGQLKQFVSAFEKYDAPAGDIIISQGDHINNHSGDGPTNEISYFYVIHRGIVEFTIDDQHVGTAGVGESFGEYALLYNTPRSVTVLAIENVELFRVDALTFRRILSSQTQSCTHKKCRLIETIHFFELVIDECNVADHVVPQAFGPGDTLVDAGETYDKLFIIGEGVVHRRTTSSGRVDTLAMKQGDYFGERALVGTDVSASTYIAATRGLAFTIDRRTFEEIVLNKINPATAALIVTAIRNDQMIRKLAVLQLMIQYAEPIQIVTLASCLKDKSYSAGEKILVEKESVRASLFYVKAGEVTISTSDSVAKIVPIGGWFGEAHMTKAYSKGKKTTKCVYAVNAKTDCTFSVLTLKDFVSIVAPQLQSSSTICPEPIQAFAVLEQIEEVTESGVEPVVIEQVIDGSTKSRGAQSKTSASSVTTEEPARVSKHDEKHSNHIRLQRQLSDSSSTTTASNIINSSIHSDSFTKSEIVPVKQLVKSTTTCLTTATVTTAQPPKQMRKLPVKRQRQLSFVRVAPLSVRLNQLQKHTILGEGTFGIVWLVSDPTNQKENKYYALKKQSKAFLVGENQVEAVIQEKIMLENMRHPFLIQLEKTYQDEYFIYMLLEFVQGGELFSLMHEDESSILPEHQAKFYALCLSDVLDYLRSRKYVYRDLKGENVMLDAKGYVKLIDFGFCKYLLAEKTYTLCGTPGYLSPEMVTVQGHSFSSDNWSLGVLIYEMIAGSSPFYYDGIDQVELFDAIAQNDYPPLPCTVSDEAKDLIAGLLQKDPVERYGSVNRCKIHEHAWFNELDLESMRHREMAAPWVPYLDGPLDTCNFTDWSELEQAERDGTIGADGDVSKKGLAVSKKDQKQFEGVF